MMPYMYLFLSSSLTRYPTSKFKTLLIFLMIMTIIISFDTTLNYYKSESRINQYTQLQESYNEAKGNL